MSRKGEDPMSNLLSDLGGIDSSLFQKRQAMRDMRAPPPSQAQSSQAPKPSPRPQQVPSNAAPQYQPTSYRGPVPQSATAKSQSAVGSGQQADKNSQLDALLGGGVFAKSNRPMRETAKPAQRAVEETNRPVEAPRPAPPATSTRQPQTTTAYSGALSDDLDSVFGSSAAPSRQQKASAQSNDPFAVFGNLGTTEVAPSPSQRSSLDGEFLSDFTSSPGAPPQPSARSIASPQSVTQLRSVASGGGSDDWGGMTSASPGLASPNYSSAHEDDGSGPGFHQATPSQTQPPEVPTSPPSRQRSQPEPPPPSYESVMRVGRTESPRTRPGSGRYQAYQDDDWGQDQEYGGSARSRPPRSTDASYQKGSRHAPPPDQIKDQAKQWLSAGQKWLSGASKKVAQAVKETQATISSKLEELDVRGGESGSTSQQPSTASRGSLEGIPTYYYDWAETIRVLPAHEQGPTLAAMPDEDARIIQQILRRPPGHVAAAAPPSQAPTSPQQQRRAFSGELSGRQYDTPSGRSRSTELAQEAADTPQSRARPSQPSPVKPRQKRETPAAPAEQDRQGSTDLMGLGETAPQPAPAAEPEVDLMGLREQPPKRQASPVSRREAQAAAAEDPEVDLLGLSGKAATVAAQPDVHDMFGSPAAAPSGRSMPEDLEALFGNRPASSKSTAGRGGGGADSMIDFGLEEDDVEDWMQPSGRDEEQEGEPEARKIARQRRLAATRARMQRQLAEKQARDRAEAQQQEAQHDLRSHHRERIEAWKSGKKDNIRALLSTLHTVLWENSGWTPPGMSDLVEPPRVKRWYMKANLVVHPDKVKQKGGSVEQIVIADMAFDTLKTAWSRFEATELKSR